MNDRSPLVPDRLVHARRDVDAKQAFLIELERRGFVAHVIREPADIIAEKGGERFYFEIKKTSRSDSYFGAATLTEWVAALEHPNHYYFVTAQVTDGGWVFHQYSGEEFMRFSTIPPFKVFFQIPVGSVRAGAPLPRATRSVRLTVGRVREMAVLFARWRADGGVNEAESEPATQAEGSDSMGVDGRAE